jgi:hypothetical protein
MQSSDQLSSAEAASTTPAAREDDVGAHWNRVVQRRSFLKG